MPEGRYRMPRRGRGRWWDDRGSVAVIIAVALPAMAGAAGLGVDVGLWYHTKRLVQTAADAGAIAGAVERQRGGLATVEAAALDGAAKNGFAPGPGSDVIVRTPPQQGAYTGNPIAVEVFVTQQRTRLLSAVFGGEALTVAARAVAIVDFAGSACVLALHETAIGGVGSGGNPTITMDGCVIASNSNNDAAILVDGNATLSAYSIWTVGDYSVGSSASLDLDRPPITRAYPIPDPYANLVLPEFDPGACIMSGGNLNTTQTLQPGVYCDGLRFGSSASITLEPGTYILDKGEFRINGGARVRCNCPSPEDGVTFILTSSGDPSTIAYARINGGADIDLQAPSGPDADIPGMAMVQDRRALPDGVNRLNGGSDMFFRGAFYFPTQTVEWSGSNDTTVPGCVQIVASKVVFPGTSAIDNQACAEGGVNTIPILQVRLVE